MAISRAQLLKELLPGLNALFGLEYAKYGEEHAEIFETEASDRSFEVILSDIINLRRQWTFENIILRGNSSKYPYIENFIANTLNTYVKPQTGDVLVATNCIPSYNNKQINPYDRKLPLQVVL